MKKNYKAPTFDVITYSLHEAIAGNCTITYDEIKADEDFKGYAFVDGDNNCTPAPLIGYCYFTSAGTIVANS